MRNYFEFQCFQVLQCFTVACKGYTIRKLDVEDIDVQSPLCGDFGVKLPQGACRSVSGIGE